MISRFAILKPVARLFLAARRPALLGGMLLALLTALAGMALLGLSGWFITASAIAGLSGAVLNVFLPSASIRLLAIGRTAGRYGERLTTHEATLGILAAVRERLFLGWSTPASARFLRFHPARLLHRLTADIDALESVYLRILVPAFAAIGATLAAGVVLGALSLWLGIAAGLWLIATGLVTLLVASRLAERHARRRAYGIEAIRSRAIDLVSGQTELMMSGRLQAQRAASARADRFAAEADTALNRLDAGMTVVFGAASAILVSATLLAVAALSEAGSIGAPAAVLGLLVALTATEQFGPLRRGALELGRTLLSAHRVGPRLDARRSEACIHEPAQGHAVELSNVTVHHDGSSAAALLAVDLSVDKGEIVAVVGPSGAGKSSLLSLLAGELEIAGGELSHIRATVLTQRTELFEGTIRANLLLAKPSADEQSLREVLAVAGLAREVEALERGLDTRLGEGGSGLSGGQSRRLALARFFLSDAPLWLLDEPTEGLDGATARDVIARIERQARGRTVVIATHMRREAAFANRIAVMEGGRIIEIACREEAAFETALDRLRPD